jgi:catechol 2,3-dioxygenase-like lactoylglutathione lyase family enzyme
MFDHVGLRVKDVAASGRFYRALLAPLGHVPDESGTGFGPPGTPALWLYAAAKDNAPPGCHLAFRAPDRASVDRFHAAGVKAGARDNGAPGLRPDYSPGYYAAFVVDADGNNVEAVYLG